MVNWYQHEVTQTSFEVMYAYDKFEVKNTVKRNENNSKLFLSSIVLLNFALLEKVF